LTYIFFPICLIGIGLGLKKFENYERLSQIAMITGIVSGIFIFSLFSDPNSGYRGILQRIIETSFIVFMVCSALRIGAGAAVKL